MGKEKIPAITKNREIYLLVAFFIVLLLIKILLVLPMQCPSIIGDETTYAGNAKDFASNIGIQSIMEMKNPPVYSIILSIAYILGDPSGANYHLLLIINAFIGACILFPAYYLLRNYCDFLVALSGAVLVCVVPAVFNWGFYVMTETLFTTLFVCSLYAMNRMFLTNKLIWVWGMAVTLLLMVGTKAVGIYEVPLALIAALFFVLLCRRTGVFDQVKQTQALFIGLCALLIAGIAWVFLTISNVNAYTAYNTGGYLSHLITIFIKPDLILTFLILFIRETQILVLASYLVLFVSAFLLLYYLVMIPISSTSDWEEIFSTGFFRLTQSNNLLVPALTSLVFFVLLSVFVSLVLVTNHMMYVPTWQYVGEEQFFQIFSRYLDPVIPGLLIIGIIGMSILNFSRNYIKTRNVFTISLLVSIFLFYVNFPFLGYRIGDTLSIFSFSWLSALTHSEFTGFCIVAFLLSVATSLFLYAMKKSKIYYFLLFLVAVSLVLSGYTYTLSVSSSENAYFGWGGACGRALAESIPENARVFVFYGDEGDSAEISRYIIPFYIQRAISVVRKEELESENFTISLSEQGVPVYLVSDVPLIVDQRPSLYGYPGYILQVSG
ncbi:MAG: glycosyltransferase family 39 protein [Methanospirillaceae archaeon]|nr:glycosyltransferase family 39 protein [Methanospirillaceae archaeon]